MNVIKILTEVDSKNFILLNSRIPATKIEKSDKTDLGSVTNAEFISAVFGELEDNKRPVIVAFIGNPATVSKGSWFGNPYIPHKTNFYHGNNNYISFATFKPDPQGKYRRRKQDFASLHAIMLDDIGGKVAIERIALTPSWKIETSKNNFQIGFILNEPISDPAQADKLLNAIIDAGLTDPGANGPCSRIGRLPVAVNGKYKQEDGNEWKCRLTEWNPQLRYSVSDIVKGLEIELKDDVQKEQSIRQRISKSATKQNQNGDDNYDEIHVSKSDENPVVIALKSSGRYKQTLGVGKHDITCPWVGEHTDQVDQGTAYFEPNEIYPIGGFKCLHGHCSNRKVKNLLEFLNISNSVAKHKPFIYLQAGELPRICEAAEKELAKTLLYYQRGGNIVTILLDPSTLEISIKSVSVLGLIHALAGLIVWMRFDKRSDEWQISDPSEKHVRHLHDSLTYTHLPILNGIARQPYLRPDGSLMTTAGYDPQTCMFGAFDATQFSVPDSPTRQDAENALAEVIELLSEFVFKTPHDLASAISAILTATIRPSLSNAPMNHVKAPSISSGKSYLCELVTAFATAQKGTPHAFPTDDEECRKLLLSELLTSPAVIEFDNLTSDLIPHKSLCTALTSEFISGRILGQSKTAEASTRALFLSSGNNVQPVRDMTRRTVTITLDPACETPAARDFTKQPVSEVRTNRGRYVSLALTIVRAWVCAGRPKTQCKSIASYSDWSDYCRQSLLWLGLPDPANCIFEAMNEDPDRELLGNLLIAWFNRFHSSTVLVKEVIAAAQPSFNNLNGVSVNLPLSEALQEVAAEREVLLTIDV